MSNNVSLFRLQEAWRECERNIYHLCRALTSLAPILPMTGERLEHLTDALDVGWQRTAAIWGAYDPDLDCWTLYHEHYVGEQQPTLHAAAIKAPGEWICGVVDPAARGRSQVDGEKLLDLYQDLGLHLEPAENAVETGIYQVWERLSTGRLKVCRSLANFRKEIKRYERDAKGHIIKKDDHLMDATRYLILSGGAVAKPVPVARGPQPDSPSGAGRPGGWMA